jgi:hypothetical protein
MDVAACVLPDITDQQDISGGVEATLSTEYDVIEGIFYYIQYVVTNFISLYSTKFGTVMF